MARVQTGAAGVYAKEKDGRHPANVGGAPRLNRSFRRKPTIRIGLAVLCPAIPCPARHKDRINPFSSLQLADRHARQFRVAGPFAFAGDNEIKIVQVDISYKNEGDPDHFTETVVLKSDKPEGEKLTRIMGKIIDAPLVYKATYFPKNNSPITGPEKKFYLTENNNVKLFISSPYENTLDLPVELSQVPDESVKKIIVEFKYADETNNFSSYDKIEMSAEEDWEPGTAKLVIMDKTNSKFQYRYRIISKDAMSKSAWINGEGEEAIILPIFKVLINATQLKLGQEFSNALLTLNYDSETKDTREIFLDQATASQVLTWYIPRTDNSQSTYSYLLKLMEQDGTAIETSGTNQGSVLTLQAPAH